eukprot:2104062-Heterocapsa_arctica.AAC.1
MDKFSARRLGLAVLGLQALDLQPVLPQHREERRLPHCVPDLVHKEAEAGAAEEQRQGAREGLARVHSEQVPAAP